MNIFKKLFKKEPLKPILKMVTTCSKHGEIPNYTVKVIDREYAICWDCLGEFGSQYCTREMIEVK